MEKLYLVKHKYVTKKSYRCHDNAKNAISLDPSQPLNSERNTVASRVKDDVTLEISQQASIVLLCVCIHLTLDIPLRICFFYQFFQGFVLYNLIFYSWFRRLQTLELTAVVLIYSFYKL